MNESKDFRKGIYQLEWERKKMIMEIEDLLQKAKDIQRLKVTKELQFVSINYASIRLSFLIIFLFCLHYDTG